MKIPCGSACKGLLSGLLFLLAVIIAPLVSIQASAAPTALNNHDLGLTPQSPPTMFVGLSCDGQRLTYPTVGTAFQTPEPDRSVSSTGYLASIATRTRRTDVPPITVQPQAPTDRNIAAFQPSDGPALDYKIAADAYRTSGVGKHAPGAAAVATRTRNLEVPPLTVHPRQSPFYRDIAAFVPLDRSGQSDPAYLRQGLARGQPWRT